MKDFFAGMELHTNLEVKDVIDKLLVIKTNEPMTQETVQKIGEYLKEKGCLGFIAMPKDSDIREFDDEDLEKMGLKRIDFMSELDGL